MLYEHDFLPGSLIFHKTIQNYFLVLSQEHWIEVYYSLFGTNQCLTLRYEAQNNNLRNLQSSIARNVCVLLKV